MELINNEKTLYTAFLCIGYGVICGLIFSAVSLLFPLQKSQNIRRAIWDISLSFWSALGLFLLSLSLTDGRPRFVLFGGTALGFFAWKKLFERRFSAVIRWIMRPILSGCRTIGSIFHSQRVNTQKNFKKMKFFSKRY